MADFKYDVAISCSKEDEPRARELHELLAGRVKSLFLYTQNQKELIGEDGLDALGQTYSKDSRLVVVVFRKGWGATKWTGVEDRAIRDLYLNTGIHRILVYSMDGSTPTWLPATYLWASERYGLKALAATIERKVQEEGGAVGSLDPVALAESVGREQAAAVRREERRFTYEAVRAAHEHVAAINTHLEELAKRTEVSQPGLVRFEATGRSVVVRTNEAAIVFRWGGWASNSVRGGKLELLVGPLRAFGIDAFGDDARRGIGLSTEATYEFQSADDETNWLWVDQTGVCYSSTEVADDAFVQLVTTHKRLSEARLQRDRRGG